MSTILRTFALSVVLSMLAACTTITTDNPIGVSGGVQGDARLIGGWKIFLDGDLNGKYYVFFLPLKEGSIQALCRMEPDRNHETR